MSKSPEDLAIELEPEVIDKVLEMTTGQTGYHHSGVLGCIYLLGKMRPKGWGLNDAKVCLDWLWEVNDVVEGRVLRTSPPPSDEPFVPSPSQPTDMVTVVDLDGGETRMTRQQYEESQRTRKLREIEQRTAVALKTIMKTGRAQPDFLSQQQVLVHADGGMCHGTALVDGRCPACRTCPDMQSTELWPRRAAR